ncbi:MAG: acetyl-CoA carboxylase biotin carboxyl carrier protein [Campylobacterales bacterium]|nr:acetyl-CoA carboxylase biotin carboxyl carrier protein [Campylobacterales bacterium]
MKKQDIKDLMKFFDSTGITRLHVKENDFEIEIEKRGEVTTLVSAPAQSVLRETAIQQSVPAQSAVPCVEGPSIKSPMVGTFYQAPAPGAAPFIKIGQVVKKGQPIAIIEAMKIMNEIEAEFDCKIVSILVEDGQPVEFDMPLFSVEKL